MKEDMYKGITKKMIEDTLIKMMQTEKLVKKERKFKMGTGKLGCINYLNVLNKDFNTKEEMIVLNKKWQDELPEGMYMITEEGVEYYGQGLKKQMESL